MSVLLVSAAARKVSFWQFIASPVLDHPGQTQLTDQRRNTGNFVGLAVNFKMGKDDLLGDRKRTQGMHRLAIVDRVEAASEGLAIQCDERQSLLGGAVTHEMLGIATRARLQGIATNRMQKQAHRVDRRRTLEITAKHLIEKLPTLAHENDDMGKTLRPRQHRQDAGQKKIRQREAPSLGTARIGNGTQSVNQTGITDHGILTSYTLPQSDPRFPRMCQLHHVQSETGGSVSSASDTGCRSGFEPRWREPLAQSWTRQTHLKSGCHEPNTACTYPCSPRRELNRRGGTPPMAPC